MKCARTNLVRSGASNLGLLTTPATPDFLTNNVSRVSEFNRCLNLTGFSLFLMAFLGASTLLPALTPTPMLPALVS